MLGKSRPGSSRGPSTVENSQDLDDALSLAKRGSTEHPMGASWFERIVPVDPTCQMYMDAHGGQYLVALQIP